MRSLLLALCCVALATAAPYHSLASTWHGPRDASTASYWNHRADVLEYLQARGDVDPRGAASGTDNFPVWGNIAPLGIYAFNVSVGSPGKTFTVAIDTGSNDFAVPLITCDGCHSTAATEFDPSASHTFTEAPCDASICNISQCQTWGSEKVCGYVNKYGSCNLTAPNQACFISGPQFYDVITVGPYSATAFMGGINGISKNFQQFFTVTAIFGFAYSRVWGLYKSKSAFEYLVEAGQVANQFALCLNPYSGGTITFGGADPMYYTGDFAYTPITKHKWYFVQVVDVWVDDQVLPVSSPYQYKATIVDSGTNILVLSWAGFNSLHAVFKANCSTSNLVGICPGAPNTTVGHTLFSGECFDLSEDQIDAFPDIVINLVGGVGLSISGRDYLVDGADGKKCLGIAGGPFAVIGDVVMQNYYILFDRINNQIGWAPVTAACGTTA